MPGLVPPITDERSLLIAYLDQQRQAVRIAAFGLTDDQGRQAPSVSSLTIGGLVKHVTAVERTWVDMILKRERKPSAADDYVAGFTLLPEETLAGVLDRYVEVARQTDELLGSVDLDQDVPVPKGVPWFPQDVEAWSVRWVILHVIEETARHAGHADIVRESIDGATAFPLMAAVEGWPATPWMQPWQPPPA